MCANEGLGQSRLHTQAGHEPPSYHKKENVAKGGGGGRGERQDGWALRFVDSGIKIILLENQQIKMQCANFFVRKTYQNSSKRYRGETTYIRLIKLLESVAY